MKRIGTLIVICVLLIISLILGCSQSMVREVTFEQLFSNPSRYNDKEITIEGFYFQGFEVDALCERLKYSGLATGHLVPQGQLIWVSGGIPKEVYDRLTLQQMMGPSERYGRLRITGKFEYGGQYGHLGGYDTQITPIEVMLLSWLLPETTLLKVSGH